MTEKVREDLANTGHLTKSTIFERKKKRRRNFAGKENKEGSQLKEYLQEYSILD